MFSRHIGPNTTAAPCNWIGLLNDPVIAGCEKRKLLPVQDATTMPGHHVTRSVVFLHTPGGTHCPVCVSMPTEIGRARWLVAVYQFVKSIVTFTHPAPGQSSSSEDGLRLTQVVGRKCYRLPNCRRSAIGRLCCELATIRSCGKRHSVSFVGGERRPAMSLSTPANPKNDRISGMAGMAKTPICGH